MNQTLLRQNILEILTQDARQDPAMIAKMLGASEKEIKDEILAMEQENIILRYSAVINDEITDEPGDVHALIEVKVTPQYQHGYEAIADTICEYDEVRSCYLMSGSYDYMVLVDGKSLRNVARFVAEKLAVIDGVTSTATHFVLRKYKDNHVMMPVKNDDCRQVVTP